VAYLIRTIENRDEGSFEYRDNEFPGNSITIGRATDQDVQLTEPEAGLHQASISIRGKGRGSIKDLTSPPTMLVNENVVRSASLKPGDNVRIGNSVMVVIEPPPGFEFALTLERGDSRGDETVPGSQYVTTLEQTSLNKRSWSWLLFIVVLVLFLAIPAAGLLNDQVQSLTRSTPLPDDGAWDTGPLIDAHHIPEIGDDCNVCHLIPFRMVRNEQCLTCHEDTGRHAEKSVHPGLDQTLCESCHKEHNEPPAIVRQDEALCADCHQSLKAAVSGTELRDASSFGDDHPEFRLTMLEPVVQGEVTVDWRTVRVDQSSQLTEQSNLKFPHDKHLDPEGVKSPEGDEVMVCSDCHTLDAQGLLMKPITMEDSCRRCHTLVFDEDNPAREVPHGDPDTVILALEEYYSREFLEKSLGDQADQEETGTVETEQAADGEAAGKDQRRTRRKRRRAGTTMDSKQRYKVLQLARDKAWEVAGQIFEKTTCLICHEITREDTSDLLSKWRVEPVRITGQWMPRHEFNHYSHRTEECTLCHSAETSEISGDVLMPDLASCRECHGSGSNQLATTCIGCHNFHLESFGPIDQ